MSGDENISGMNSQGSSVQGAKPPNAFVRFIKKLFALCIVLAIGALTFVLLSERNTRRYKLQREQGGKLYVLRGMKLPAGFERWHPDDQELAETYAPFTLSEEVLAGLYSDTVYEERDELDRALFSLHQDSIEMLAGRDDSKSIETVVRLLGRASRLGGVTAVQRNKLKSMTAKSSFFEGRLRLQEAAALLQMSTSKLRLALESDESGFSGPAGKILDEIKVPASVIVNAARSYQSGQSKSDTDRNSGGETDPEGSGTPEASLRNNDLTSGSTAPREPENGGDRVPQDSPALRNAASSAEAEKPADSKAAEGAEAYSEEEEAGRSGEDSREPPSGEGQEPAGNPPSDSDGNR